METVLRGPLADFDWQNITKIYKVSSQIFCVRLSLFLTRPFSKQHNNQFKLRLGYFHIHLRKNIRLHLGNLLLSILGNPIPIKRSAFGPWWLYISSFIMIIFETRIFSGHNPFGWEMNPLFCDVFDTIPIIHVIIMCEDFFPS